MLPVKKMGLVDRLLGRLRGRRDPPLDAEEREEEPLVTHHAPCSDPAESLAAAAGRQAAAQASDPGSRSGSCDGASAGDDDPGPGTGTGTGTGGATGSDDGGSDNGPGPGGGSGTGTGTRGGDSRATGTGPGTRGGDSGATSDGGSDPGGEGRIDKPEDLASATDARAQFMEALRPQLRCEEGATWFTDAPVGEGGIALPLAPGLTAVLITHQGVWDKCVTGNDLKSLGVTTAEAWHAAIDNAFREPFEAKLVQLPKVSAFLLVGNGAFVASMVIDTPRACATVGVAPGAPEAGVLAAVPNGHALVLLPLKAGLGTDALGDLATLVAKLHDYADAISPQIYWWRPSLGFLGVDPSSPPPELLL